MNASELAQRAIRVATDPSVLVYKAWAKRGWGTFAERLEYDVVERPHYAFCLYHAARQAHALGISSISAIEFGVAGGNGLVAAERLCREIERIVPVSIELYGFDLGSGLPTPVDYRDLPYIWKEGFFAMDVDAIDQRIERSVLVLGDVAETVVDFHSTYDAAPIGAMFFDLDYYSSTKASFRILDTDPKHFLPRVMNYFDDVVSNPYGGILCDSVGQLLAIKEYNNENSNREFAQIEGLSYSRRRPAAWNSQIYAHHAFDHPQYCEYVHTDRDRQLPLAQERTQS